MTGKEARDRVVTIDGINIHLREPDTIECDWVGQREVYRLLSAAFLKVRETDSVMTPVLVGPPGSGKTTLACAVAKAYQLPLYLVNCTADMRPDDLLVTPVLSSDRRVLYRASGLVSAMIHGGICILDEANRMNEKTWASLASLLDDRRYIESVIAGVKIAAHPEFRLVATMNDDSSTFNIPEYIESRLKPILPVEFPSQDELRQIIAHHVPHVDPDLIQAIQEYLEGKKKSGCLSDYSVRDAILILRYREKLAAGEDVSIDYVAKKILKIQESRPGDLFI